ncbi:MAG: twin-arginine translocation signal domain-containing protein [Pyrinomonadaceae bacterium]|nr:twin-arginine translocation signal domain-containing protein [Pyrinomonadaceae bacterium]
MTNQENDTDTGGEAEDSSRTKEVSRRDFLARTTLTGAGLTIASLLPTHLAAADRRRTECLSKRTPPRRRSSGKKRSKYLSESTARGTLLS